MSASRNPLRSVVERIREAARAPGPVDRRTTPCGPASEMESHTEREDEVLHPLILGNVVPLPLNRRGRGQFPEYVPRVGAERQASRREPLDARSDVPGESRAEPEARRSVDFLGALEGVVVGDRERRAAA